MANNCYVQRSAYYPLGKRQSMAYHSSMAPQETFGHPKKGVNGYAKQKSLSPYSTGKQQFESYWPGERFYDFMKTRQMQKEKFNLKLTDFRRRIADINELAFKISNYESLAQGVRQANKKERQCFKYVGRIKSQQKSHPHLRKNFPSKSEEKRQQNRMSVNHLNQQKKEHFSRLPMPPKNQQKRQQPSRVAAIPREENRDQHSRIAVELLSYNEQKGKKGAIVSKQGGEFSLQSREEGQGKVRSNGHDRQHSASVIKEESQPRQSQDTHYKSQLIKQAMEHVQIAQLETPDFKVSEDSACTQ